MFQSCPSVPDKGANTIDADYLIPAINNAAFKAKKYSVQISNQDFYTDVNRQLESGFFKYRLPKFEPSEFCFQPGYVVKKIDGLCNMDSCDGNMFTAIKLVINKNSVKDKEFSFGESTKIAGYSEKEATNFMGFRAMQSVSNISNELSKSINK